MAYMLLYLVAEVFHSLCRASAVGPVQGRRAGAGRRRPGASTHGHLVGAQLGHVPSEQLQLLVALVVLLSEVLVLSLQISEFVGHPLLDARRFGFDHFGILEPQLTLYTRTCRSYVIIIVSIVLIFGAKSSYLFFNLGRQLANGLFLFRLIGLMSSPFGL